MLTEVRVIEEVIEYIREQLPKDMSALLADSEFNRGRASQLHDLIDNLERLSVNVEHDWLIQIEDDNNG